METSSGSASPTTNPPLPPKGRRRLWRVLLAMFVLFVLLVLAMPHMVALEFVRTEAQEKLSQTLGVPCRIDRIGFSWFSGFGVQGVEIANPPGFSREQPCLRIARVGGSVGIAEMLGGRVEFAGAVDGLQVRVEENAAGETNFGALFGDQIVIRRDPAPGPKAPPRPRTPTTKPNGHLGDLRLDRVQFDLQLRDALFEIRREGQLLQAVSDVNCQVRKTFDAKKVTVDLTANLQPVGESTRTGQLAARLDADITTHDVDAMLSTTGMDLARFHPLVEAMMPGQLTDLAGFVDGTLTATLTGGGALQLGGNLTARSPRLAGPLVHGMRITGERWALAPTLTVADASEGVGRGVQTERFDADFGCLRIRGIPTTELAPQFGDKPMLAFRCEADLGALAAFGGPMPAWLGGSKGRMEWVVGLPPDLRDVSVESLLRAVVAHGSASAERIAFAGYEFTGLGLSATLADGKLQIGTTQDSKLNQGPLTLHLTADLTGEAARPANLALEWNGGQLAGPATGLLRHLVPLFAGLDPQTADLRGACELSLQANGPTQRGAQQSWLELFDTWTASGRIGLRETSFAPAPALRALLQPLGPTLGDALALGADGRIDVHAFRSEFELQQGQIRSQVGEWTARGKKIGLQGSTGLDGRIAYQLDLTEVLAAHRDGAKVLQALGGKLPAANLAGTLDAPTLGLPDVFATLRNAATKELEKRGGDLIQRGLDELLRRNKKK